MESELRGAGARDVFGATEAALDWLLEGGAEGMSDDEEEPVHDTQEPPVEDTPTPAPEPVQVPVPAPEVHPEDDDSLLDLPFSQSAPTLFEEASVVQPQVCPS